MIAAGKFTWKHYAALAVFVFVFYRVILNAFNKQRPKGEELSFLNLADKIYAAGFDAFGTDEETIYNVFLSLKNNTDFEKLDKAFGERRAEYTLGSRSLVQFLRSELNASEIAKVNKILASKNITYRV